MYPRVQPLLCSCRIHWSRGSQPNMERCRWCRCLSTRGPTRLLNTSSLCYTPKRAYPCRMIYSASCRAKRVSILYLLHCILRLWKGLPLVYYFGLLKLWSSSHTPYVSSLTRCMRWWGQPWECYHTWCQTAAAGGGMPWRMWQKRAELLTPNSVYTSSSAALPGRSPQPLLAGSTHLEEKHRGGLDTGRPLL